MACLQTLPEVGGYTSIYKKGTKESAWQRDVTRYYGADITRALQGRADDQYDYYARCKRAAILWAWINGEPIETIEKSINENEEFEYFRIYLYYLKIVRLRREDNILQRKNRQFVVPGTQPCH